MNRQDAKCAKGESLGWVACVVLERTNRGGAELAESERGGRRRFEFVWKSSPTKSPDLAASFTPGIGINSPRADGVPLPPTCRSGERHSIPLLPFTDH